MIDPAKLMDENGFVDGCVVECTYPDARIRGVWYMVNGVVSNIDIDTATSIRPLTGPMAVWNFAPEDTSVLVQNSNGWFWMNHEPDCLAQSDIVSRRPFWARSEK